MDIDYRALGSVACYPLLCSLDCMYRGLVGNIPEQARGAPTSRLLKFAHVCTL